MADKLELGIIVFVSIGLYLFDVGAPSQVYFGLAVVWLAAIIFIQSLIRDLSIMVRKSVLHRKNARQKASESRCLCMESVLGVSVLLSGFLLMFAGNATLISVDGILKSVIVFVVLVLGFSMRNLVVFLKPLRIRSEKEHMNIIVKW